MMQKLLIFSKCESISQVIIFHFKGFYRGKKISVIQVIELNIDFNFKVKEDYLLWVQELSIEGEILKVRLFSAKHVA